MCDHILGPINPNTGKRTCLNCHEQLDSAGTYSVERLEGNLEVYPAGLFAQWQGHHIRKFLNVQKGDIVLHNWNSNNIYVFRCNHE